MSARRKTTVYVVHVTADRPLYDVATTSAEDRARMNREALERIRADHKRADPPRKKAWADIGYHWITFPDGETLPGRPADQIGSHVGGWNSASIGHAFYGGLDENGKPSRASITPQAWEAFWAHAEEQIRTRWPEARICGHRDLSPDLDGDGIIERHEWLKECPCFDAIPEAARRGLPVMPISGEWRLDDPRRPAAPDARVTWLQQLLDKAGYDFGPNDGFEGPATVQAIEQFMADNGLKGAPTFGNPFVVKKLRTIADDSFPRAPTQVAPPPGSVGGLVSTQLLAAIQAAGAIVVSMPLWLSIALVVVAAGLCFWGVRSYRRTQQAAAAAARGDVLPEPEPDTWDAAVAFVTSLAGGGPRRAAS